MKRKLLTFGTAALFLIGASFIATSCGNQQDSQNEDEQEQMDADTVNAMASDKTEQVEDNNTEQTAAVYACPMHPEVTGKEGDKCSECGMPLEKVEKEDHSGHDHE